MPRPSSPDGAPRAQFISDHDQQVAAINDAVSEVVRHWAEDGCALGHMCVGHNLQRQVDDLTRDLGEHPAAIVLSNLFEVALIVAAESRLEAKGGAS